MSIYKLSYLQKVGDICTGHPPPPAQKVWGGYIPHPPPPPPIYASGKENHLNISQSVKSTMSKIGRLKRIVVPNTLIL